MVLGSRLGMGGCLLVVFELLDCIFIYVESVCDVLEGYCPMHFVDYAAGLIFVVILFGKCDEGDKGLCAWICEEMVICSPHDVACMKVDLNVDYFSVCGAGTVNRSIELGADGAVEGG